MSAPDTNAFQNWFKALPIPWFVAGPNGQAEAATWPAVLDQQVALLKSARKACFPDYAPVDALSHIGSDRQLIQGTNESNTSFVTRTKDPWSQWLRAGTALSVLEQLGCYGFGNSAYWVQQNGLQYNLSAAPTAGQDPTSLLVSTNDATLSSTLTSAVAPYRTIPSGTPWFAFDLNTDLTNRFAIVVPSWPFSALAPANFANSSTATVTWPFTFGNTSYGVIIGPPSSQVNLSAGSLTTTGCTITASASWTGTVYVIGYASGINPLNVFTSTSAGTIQRVITTFRPNALCYGVFSILTGGRTWDYFPSGTTWDGGTYATWDTNTTSQILGAF